MKINDVRITNWRPLGTQYWDEVASRPTEPLIEAVISMTLSHDEYQKLLSDNRISQRKAEHLAELRGRKPPE